MAVRVATCSGLSDLHAYLPNTYHRRQLVYLLFSTVMMEVYIGLALIYSFEENIL